MALAQDRLAQQRLQQEREVNERENKALAFARQQQEITGDTPPSLAGAQAVSVSPHRPPMISSASPHRPLGAPSASPRLLNPPMPRTPTGRPRGPSGGRAGLQFGNRVGAGVRPQPRPPMPRPSMFARFRGRPPPQENEYETETSEEETSEEEEETVAPEPVRRPRRRPRRSSMPAPPLQLPFPPQAAQPAPMRFFAPQPAQPLQQLSAPPWMRPQPPMPFMHPQLGQPQPHLMQSAPPQFGGMPFPRGPMMMPQQVSTSHAPADARRCRCSSRRLNTPRCRCSPARRCVCQCLCRCLGCLASTGYSPVTKRSKLRNFEPEMLRL